MKVSGLKMAKRKKVNYNNTLKIFIIIFLICSFIYSVYPEKINNFLYNLFPPKSYAIDAIPEYNKNNYVVINNNEPLFTDEDKEKKEIEVYSNLDILGRAGVAYAKVSKDTMPTEERKSIGMIKPSGWHTVKYENVDGKYLYNRCHLIGFQLTGENANEKNLITCTRQMNTVGMLEFENKVAEYVKKTNNHVLYRVTPVYKDNNLLASGVLMEAYSLEDEGRGIKFYVYVYNVQDGITIDYKTGDSELQVDN